MPSTESSGVLARLQGTVAEKKQQVAAIHAKAEAMRLARLGGGEAPPPAGAVPRAQPPPRGQVPKAPSKAGSTFKAAVDAAGLSAKEKDKDKDRDKEKEKDKGKKDKDKKDKKKKDKDKKDRTHKLEEVPEPPPKGWIKRYTGHFTHQSFGQTSISVSVKLESHDAGVWMIMGQVVDSTVKVIREGERMIFSDGMVTLDGRCRLLGFVRGYTIMEGECGGAFVLAPLEPDGSARRPPRLDQATRRTEEEAKWWYEVTEEVMEEEEDSAHQQQLPEERRRRAKTVAKLWVKADKKAWRQQRRRRRAAEEAAAPSPARRSLGRARPGGGQRPEGDPALALPVDGHQAASDSEADERRLEPRPRPPGGGAAGLGEPAEAAGGPPPRPPLAGPPPPPAGPRAPDAGARPTAVKSAPAVRGGR